jgi:formylglycine-generating enzyme required for sulfatase activity
MVLVPTTTFEMGSTLAELDAACAEVPGGCIPDERPQLERELPVRRVTVTAFQLDAHEVTNREYVAFLTARSPELALRDDTDAHYPRFVDDLATGAALIDLDRATASITGERVGGGPNLRFVIAPGAEEQPLEGVTWDGAVRYCRDQGKRLPTEAEWEAAARGRERRRFPWGHEPPRCDAVVFGRDDARGCPARRAVHQPVGTSPQDVTPTGIHDLGGSVSEWVQDSFVASYRDCGRCTDPVVDESPRLEDDFRIFRGGNYVSPPWFSRTTTRSRSRRSYGRVGLGFRCATH